MLLILWVIKVKKCQVVFSMYTYTVIVINYPLKFKLPKRLSEWASKESENWQASLLHPVLCNRYTKKVDFKQFIKQLRLENKKRTQNLFQKYLVLHWFATKKKFILRASQTNLSIETLMLYKRYMKHLNSLNYICMYVYQNNTWTENCPNVFQTCRCAFGIIRAASWNRNKKKYVIFFYLCNNRLARAIIYICVPIYAHNLNLLYILFLKWNLGIPITC